MGLALLDRYWSADSCGTMYLEGSSTVEAVELMEIIR
jgi:hypothetical protein